jgi:multicomponent K+:H+ antiporter subunit G
MALEIALSALILIGAGFGLVGAIGLLRLGDFYRRLHAPTKASTLGVGCALIASMLYFSLNGQRLVIHELLITLFLFVTAPVSASFMIQAAFKRLKSPPGPAQDPSRDVPAPPQAAR